MKYFTIQELTSSETARKRKINNNPSVEVAKHLKELVETILDPLREAWGSGIKITSGYRCSALNKAVGGSATSAHVTGYAADTKPVNGKMKEYQQFVEKWLKENVEWDQLLHEYPKNGIDSWVHIGLKNTTGKQRKQIKTIK